MLLVIAERAVRGHKGFSQREHAERHKRGLVADRHPIANAMSALRQSFSNL